MISADRIMTEMCGGCGNCDPAQRCIGCLHEFTPAASPSPEKIAEMLAAEEPLKMSVADFREILSELLTLRAERDEARETADVSKGVAAQLGAKIIAAEAQLARQGEALNWAMDEIDVLSNKLHGFAYPQGMKFSGRSDQLDNYRKAIDARRARSTSMIRPMRTIADIEAEIGVCFNPVDGRSWYRMLGEDFGDWDCTCGHYRSTNADGSVVLIRDDTMAEINAKPRYGDPLASGWAHMVEEEPSNDTP